MTSEAFRHWLGTGQLPSTLEAELDQWFTNQPVTRTFAVRSSATAEDGALHAFAGQHETFLNVSSTVVLEKIVECWRSRDAERAVEYRRQAGLKDEDVLMAVVIQAMIPADCAGVAFCLDPINGRPDVFSIDAAFGVGETVVGGAYPVDHYTIAKSTGVIIDCHLAHKDRFIGLSSHGTEERRSTAPDAPACTAEQLVELAALLRRIESHYRYPQDIEWAFADGTLYLLQSRPITRIPEHWTREESAERFPNPVSRLNWELVDEGFHRSLGFSFSLMGLPPYEGKWFGRFDQYIYGQQTAVELYGRFARERIPDLSPVNFEQALKEFRENFAWVAELPSIWWRDLDTYLLQVGAGDALPPAPTLAEAWKRVRQLQKIGSDYFLPNIAISITQRTVTQLLLKLLQSVAGEVKGAELHSDLLARCDTKTARVNQDLWELAQMIGRSAYRERLVVDGGKALLASDWKKREPTACAKLDHILQVHGHREWDFDPYVAPWRETPDLVLEMVRGMVGRNSSPNDDGRAARVKMQKAEAIVMQACPAPAQFFISELIRLARTYTSLDDIEHYQTLRLNIPMRRALKELGGFFVEEGSLDDPMDVSFASCTLIEGRVRGEGSPDEFRRAVYAEKTEYQIAYRSEPVIDRSAPTELKTGVLQGIAGSPGVTTGVVQHVRSPDDFARFPSGAILVARTTNPAWTPLFFRAAGVVTESGGPLSHGAVTAREIGIPAVMAIPNVFQTLPEGATVTLYGSQGRIELKPAGHDC